MDDVVTVESIQVEAERKAALLEASAVPATATSEDDVPPEAIPEDEREPAHDPDLDDEDVDVPGLDDESPADDDEPSGEGEASEATDDAAGEIEGESEEGTDEGDAGPDPMLLARAESAGLNPEDFGDNEAALSRAVTAIERRYADLGAAPDAGEAEQTAPPARAAEPPPTAPAKAEDPAESAIDFEALEAEFGPQVTGVIKQLATGVTEARQEAAALRDRMAEQQTAAEAEAERVATERRVENTKWFDDQFTALGEPWVEVFGAGDETAVYNGNRKAWQERLEFANTLQAIAGGMARRGMDPPPREQLFRSALSVRYPDRATAIAKKEGSDEKEAAITKHNKRGVGRPSGTRRRQMTPQQTALAAVGDIIEKVDAGMAPNPLE